MPSKSPMLGNGIRPRRTNPTANWTILLTDFSTRQDVRESRRFHVAAGKDHHCSAGWRRALAVRGERNCATRLADKVRIDGEFFDRGANLVFRHRDHAVDDPLKMREGQRGRLRAQAVGNGPVAVLDGPVHPPTPLEAVGRIGSKLGLDPEDPDLRSPGLDRGADAGGQTPATDRYQHVLHVGQVVGDLQADRALPRDDVRMVEGRYQHAARPLQKLGRHLLALAGTTQHHLRAVVTGGSHLDPWCLARHDDVRVGTEGGSGVSNGLGVITAGVCDYAARSIGVSQVADGVEGAANLECADWLQVLRLDPQWALAVGPLCRDQRGADDGVPYPVGRGMDVLEGDQLHDRQSARFALTPNSPRTIRSAIASSCGAPARRIASPLT